MLTDPLWGATLRAVSVDVVRQRVAMDISGEKEGTFHDIVFLGVSEFRFFNGIAGPWRYADFTEIRHERLGPGNLWNVEIVLWSEISGIELRCETITLDGVEIV